MLVTLATSHSSGWLKREALCQERRGAEARAAGGMGQRPGLTLNIENMLVTLATSHSSGWLKSEAPCQERRGAEARAAGGMGQRPGLT